MYSQKKCETCGNTIVPTSGTQKYCPKCSKTNEKLLSKEYKKTEKYKKQKKKYNQEHKKQIKEYHQKYKKTEKCKEQKRKYKNTIKFKYGKYKQRATKKQIEFKITLKDFSKIFGKKCRYCNIENKNNGIDRVDNKEGYTKDNMCPCCKICNFMKSNNTKNFFINHCKRIYEHNK